MPAPEKLGYPNLPPLWEPVDLQSLVPRESGLPELFFGITRPLGADNKLQTLKHLERKLTEHKYYPYRIEIADLIETCLQQSDGGGASPHWEHVSHRTTALMSMGDALRSAIHPSVAAMMAIAEISRVRPEVQKTAAAREFRGVAYIIRHLVNPTEVSRLRSVYKQRFFAVAILESEESRHRANAERAGTATDPQHAAARMAEAEQIDAGRNIFNPSTTINVIKTIEKADLFVTTGRSRTVDRFIAQLFNYAYGTPLPSEIGMAYAFLAAKQSVCMGRSVGAVILNRHGQVVSTGWNEVAKPGGGVCREPRVSTLQDFRDFVIGNDVSDEFRMRVIEEFFHVLATHTRPDSSLFPEINSELRDKLFDALAHAQPDLADIERKHLRFLYDSDEFAHTRLLNLIEFGRTVHAEMAAITDAARRGVSTHHAHMVVTTFPCHECARNIVAAGIDTVTYLQPYEKSMAKDLYSGLIDFRSEPIDPSRWGIADSIDGSPVVFAPYEGISPNRFDELFSSNLRKVDLREAARKNMSPEGQRIDWPPFGQEEVLRGSIRGYLDTEPDQFFEVGRLLSEQSVIQDLVTRYVAFLEEASDDVSETLV